MVFNNNKIMHVIAISKKGDHETVSKVGYMGRFEERKEKRDDVIIL